MTYNKSYNSLGLRLKEEMNGKYKTYSIYHKCGI